MLDRVPLIPRFDGQHDTPHAHVWTIVLTGDASPVPARGHHRPQRHRPVRWPRAATPSPLLLRTQRTLERASRLAPAGQMVTVMTRRRAAAWEPELETVSDGLRVVQPVYRGRAAEFLLPLLKIVRRDPAATVILLPATQRIDHDARFLRYVGRAVWAVAVRPDVPLIIGAQPYAQAVDGWIEPGAPVEGLETLAVHTVKRFVDEASPAERRRLLDSQGLVSTSIFVARAQTLLTLAERTLTEVREALEPLEEAFDRPEESLLGEAIYESIPYTGLGSLERAPELAVLALPDVVWRAPEREALELLAS
jgi:mannose-1-phosphate guanylyltransferase